MPVELNRLSREYVWWRLDTPSDLAGVTVEAALLADPNAIPEDTDWIDGTLVKPTDPMGNGSSWVRLLIGPGPSDVSLAPGDYQSWIRVTDTPERPVRKPGVVTIT